MGYALQKKIWFLKIFLFFAFIVGCSDMVGNNNPFLAPLEENPKPNLDSEALKKKDNSIGEQDKPKIDNIFQLQQQYKKDCHVSEWFFCSPSIFSVELWEFELITDICVDPPQMVYMGECTLKFECDPSDPAPFEEICAFVISTGGNILGTQQKWCVSMVKKFASPQIQMKKYVITKIMTAMGW